MKKLFIIFAFVGIAARAWIEQAYPWTDVIQFPTSEKPSTNMFARNGGLFAVRTLFNGESGSSWHNTNALLQARDCWQWDIENGMFERAIPVTISEFSPASFTNDSFPQRNIFSLRAFKQWASAYCGQFVDITKLNTYGTLDDWYAANPSDTNAPMFTASSLANAAGAPYDWFDKTPIVNRGTDLDEYGWKYARSIRTTLTTIDLPIQLFKPPVNETDGGRAWHDKYCDGTDGAFGFRVGTGTAGGSVTNCADEPTLWSFNADCSPDQWPYAFLSVTNGTTPVTNVWSEHYHFDVTATNTTCPTSIKWKGLSFSAFIGTNETTAAAYCHDAMSCGFDYYACIDQNGCTNTCGASPDCLTNYTGLLEIIADCGVEHSSGELFWDGPGVPGGPTGFTDTNTYYFAKWTGNNPCEAVECHPVTYSITKTTTYFQTNDCAPPAYDTNVFTYITDCTNGPPPSDYCQNTNHVSDDPITNQFIVVAARQSALLVIDPTNLPMGCRAGGAGPLQWLWTDWASNMTYDCQCYLNFYATNGYSYSAECGAGDESGALKLYTTLTGQAPASNLYFVVGDNCGKSANDIAPMTCTNLPFGGSCNPTNIGWFCKPYGRALVKWNLNWK